jgi:hypothetical protein
MADGQQGPPAGQVAPPPPPPPPSPPPSPPTTKLSTKKPPAPQSNPFHHPAVTRQTDRRGLHVQGPFRPLGVGNPRAVPGIGQREQRETRLGGASTPFESKFAPARCGRSSNQLPIQQRDVEIGWTERSSLAFKGGEANGEKPVLEVRGGSTGAMSSESWSRWKFMSFLGTDGVELTQRAWMM